MSEWALLDKFTTQEQKNQNQTFEEMLDVLCYRPWNLRSNCFIILETLLVKAKKVFYTSKMFSSLCVHFYWLLVGYAGVFEVTDYESEVRISKFTMAYLI